MFKNKTCRGCTNGFGTEGNEENEVTAMFHPKTATSRPSAELDAPLNPAHGTASLVYIQCAAPQGRGVSGETSIPRQVNSVQKNNPMGDKSPKANQKKSAQKQTKVSVAAQQKSHAAAAKQALTKKK